MKQLVALNGSFARLGNFVLFWDARIVNGVCRVEEECLQWRGALVAGRLPFKSPRSQLHTPSCEIIHSSAV